MELTRAQISKILKAIIKDIERSFFYKDNIQFGQYTSEISNINAIRFYSSISAVQFNNVIRKLKLEDYLYVMTENYNTIWLNKNILKLLDYDNNFIGYCKLKGYI